MIPLLEQLGIDARWNIIKGTNEFYQVTKKFHNALHNRKETITPGEYEIYTETIRQNIAELQIEGDIIFIHNGFSLTFGF